MPLSYDIVMIIVFICDFCSDSRPIIILVLNFIITMKNCYDIITMNIIVHVTIFLSIVITIIIAHDNCKFEMITFYCFLLTLFLFYNYYCFYFYY